MADSSVPETPAYSSHLPSFMLVTACLFWGMGFSWAKNVGDAINSAAHAPLQSSFGPILGLAIRFCCAAVIWVCVVKGARKSWERKILWRGAVLGLILAVGIVIQHVGLARSREPVIAFLTSLTVVIVPLIAWVIHKQPPRLRLAIAVLLALGGIWLLTDATAAGFGVGEWLGFGCAVVFSIELVLINRWVSSSSTDAITGIMFMTVGVVCLVLSAIHPALGELHVSQLLTRNFLAEITLLTLLTTVLAFGLMNRYQPQVNVTRAAIIYLFEPLFATFYAWIYNGRTLTYSELLGAGLILLANLFAEAKRPRIRYHIDVQ